MKQDIITKRRYEPDMWASSAALDEGLDPVLSLQYPRPSDESVPRLAPILAATYLIIKLVYSAVLHSAK